MIDRISEAHRSWNMSRIKGANTKPEIQLRSLLHGAGYRFRLHVPYLPGRPDIVLKKFRMVIFVHGCYWHRHRGCPNTTFPGTRSEFWQEKFDATVKRDKRKAEELMSLGWRVVTVWECELKKDAQAVLERVQEEIKIRT